MCKDLEEKKWQHPVEQANFVSRRCFLWLYPLLRKGWNRNLKFEDYNQIPSFLQSENLSDKFFRSYNSREPSVWSILWALFKVSPQPLLASLFCAFFMELFQRPFRPVVFSLLLAELQKSDEEYNQNKAILYATLTCAASVIMPYLFHLYFYLVDISSISLRSALSASIYRKITKISHQGLMNTNAGEVMNLMTNGVNKFDWEYRFWPYAIISPLQLIVVSVLLWMTVGAVPVIGVVGLLIMIPIQMLFGKGLFKFRKKAMVTTDSRIKLIHEIINCMKVIKLYAWENSFWEELSKKRKNEFNHLKNIALYRGATKIMYYNMFHLILMFVLMGFTYNGSIISVSKVYLVLTMLYDVRITIGIFFSMAISGIAQILSTLQALHKFLMIEEYPVKMKAEVVQDKKATPTVAFNNVDSSWGRDTQVIVKNISFELQPGDYLCVIGEVGSGKTSLLKTVLDEMVVRKGSVKVNGKIAYACQQSWIYSDTLRNNIIFTSKYEEDKYKKVIEACSLCKDINDMPNGDESLVGERGLRLSGGQRARISLARALYHDADIYLLDDPLSAVDPEVANHLYDQSIQGYLADKIRILVTHQVSLLRHAQRILLLRKNDKPLIGTYDNLLQQCPTFAKFFTDACHDKNESSNGKIQDNLSSSNGKSEDLQKLDDVCKATSASIPWRVYKDFFKAAGNVFLIFLICAILNMAYASLIIASELWIKTWTEFEDQQKNAALLSSNFSEPGGKTESLISLKFLLGDTHHNFLVLVVLTIAAVFVSMPSIMFAMMCCIRAAKNLHDKMFDRLLHAPITFFNSNPVGEILNRFTKDIGTIDDVIPSEFQDFMMETIRVLLIVAAVCLVENYLILITAVLLVLAVFIGIVYTRSYTPLKRAENITRSPVFTHTSITLDGLSTIRAYGALNRFRNRMYQLQDVNMAISFMFICIQRWFAICADYVSVILVCITTVLPIFLRNSSSEFSASTTGFLISQLAVVSTMVQWRVRCTIELQSKFTSVERVMDYGKLEPEARREAEGKHKPHDDWPTQGTIAAYDMSLAYSGENMVLKKLQFVISGGQKIGVVGRTGAGKTSFVNALFRLEEPSGYIAIDGLDIMKIGLHQLRKKLSIIPQEPVLFQNTVRYNLDPFNVHDDAKLWSALESVELKSVVAESPKKLETDLTEGNFSLSVGQQQLVCLARAILKENKIIVMDEATSNVDVMTDQIIQRTIRSNFKDFTVITVAHRIHTIIDSDMIMVLDNGALIEFDSPRNLVINQNSHFYRIVMETGSAAPLLINQALSRNGTSPESL